MCVVGVCCLLLMFVAVVVCYYCLLVWCVVWHCASSLCCVGRWLSSVAIGRCWRVVTVVVCCAVVCCGLQILWFAGCQKCLMCVVCCCCCCCCDAAGIARCCLLLFGVCSLLLVLFGAGRCWRCLMPSFVAGVACCFCW